MHVLEVLPLSVLPPQVPQILSYYHDSSLPKGAVVEVSLNNRLVTAAVVDSYSLDEQKVLIKKSVFQLKKINKVLSASPIIAEWQFKIALWIAQHYVAALGVCLKTVLPPFFLKPRYPIKPIGSFAVEPTSPPPSWIITRAKHSIKHIQSVLKNTRDDQTLIIVPDTSFIAYFKDSLKDFNPAILTSSTSNKEYYKIWNDVCEQKIRMVIGTRQALFLPFCNLKRIILIDPLHEFYKSDMTPKYLTPELAMMIAEQYGARFIALSNLLGIEAYDKSLRTEIQVSDPMRSWTSKVSVIDLTAEFKQGYVGIFASESREMMRQTLEDKGSVLVLAARRGYAGVLLCQRCGFSFKCPSCDLPMRIHQSTELFLMCHHCEKTQSYTQVCPNCHSSQIKQVGPAGTQKKFEEIQRMMTYGQLPRAPVLILDADVTQNETEEDEVMTDVRKEGPKILIATQKVFSYLYDTKFNTVIIPQLDALSVGSDFQSTERLWYQLEKISDFEPEYMAIQTFHQKELPTILAKHDYTRLYETELAARKAFGYPPFSRLVKLSYSHSEWRKVTASARAVVEKLKLAAIHIQAKDKIQITETSPLFLRKEKDVYTYTILIKIAPDFMPRELLRYVPANWLIDLDPRTTV